MSDVWKFGILSFIFTESGQKQRRVSDKKGVLQTAAASDKGTGFGFNMTESCKIIQAVFLVFRPKMTKYIEKLKHPNFPANCSS